MRCRIGTALAVSFGVIALVAAPVGASARFTRAGSGNPTLPSQTAGVVAGTPGAAQFNGATINLADGWGGANACLEFATGTTQCFSTLAEAQQAAGAGSGADNTTSVPVSAQLRRALLKRAHTAIGRQLRPAASACNNDSSEWLWLYSGLNYGGRALGIQAPDQWIDLAGASFAKTAQSDANDTGCTVYGIENYDGSGPWDTINPWSETGNMGQFDKKLVSIYISY